jgi:hypothetical protein
MTSRLKDGPRKGRNQCNMMAMADAASEAIDGCAMSLMVDT